MAKGFIYILSNPAFPGLLKIGQTQQIPDERALELFTTAVPSRFELEFYCIADAVQALEAAVHHSLSSYRHHESREFFRVPVAEARRVILDFCAPDVVWVRDPNKARTTVLRKKCPRCTIIFEEQYLCPSCVVKLTPI